LSGAIANQSRPKTQDPRHSAGRISLKKSLHMHGLTGERTLMRIHIGERDKFRGRPLYEAIVHLLRERHFAGATVFRGIMGFGASAGIHTEKVLRLSLDLPLVIECVDTEQKIQSILPELDEMIGGGLITLERAQVIMYRGDKGEGREKP
jgi:PII-like signaling protein